MFSDFARDLADVLRAAKQVRARQNSASPNLTPAIIELLTTLHQKHGTAK
jgi:hypothetical protein